MKRLLFFVLLVSIQFSLYSQAQKDYEEYKKAVDLMKSGHYGDAIDIFEKLKSFSKFEKDCISNIAEAKRKQAYLRIANEQGPIGEQSVKVSCYKLDTMIIVRSNYKWQIDDYTSGIKAESKGNKLYVRFLEHNNDISDKIEWVKLSAGKAPNKVETVVEFVHVAHPAYLECSSENLNSPAMGFCDSIQVSSNVDWDVEYSSDWCVATSDSNMIKINVRENEGITERRTELHVRSKVADLTIVINIMQKAADEELISNKSDLYVPAEGKQEYLRIYSNSEWFVKSEPEWARVVRLPGTDSLRIECAQNITGIERKEFVKVATRTGNKTVSISLFQPAGKYVPVYPFDVLAGRDISFGINVSASYPFVNKSSSSAFTGSAINYGIGNNNEQASYSSALGFAVGLTADIRLYKNFYLKTGLNYSAYSYSNRFKGDVEITCPSKPNVSYYKGIARVSFKEEYEFSIIEVPLLASYRFVLNNNSCIHFDLGPFFSYGLSAKMDLSGDLYSKSLFEYKIKNGVRTNEKMSTSPAEIQRKYSGTFDLYEKKQNYVYTELTSGFDVKAYEELGDTPFKRFNYGLMFGVAYEYSGFVASLNYKLGLSNMANDGFWSSKRIKLYETGNSVQGISGYSQKTSYLSLSVAYIFRY